MACLRTDLHFWSDRVFDVNAGDIDVHRYHSKTEDLTEYWGSRKVLEEKRGKTWTVKNKKPEKLRECLNETEDLLSAHQPVCVSWRSPKTFRILVSNGVLLTYVISPTSCDVERISIDKTICSKVTFEQEIFDSIMADDVLICSFMGRCQLLYISFKKSLGSLEEKGEKLNAADPKYSLVDIPNASSHVVERRLALNSRNSLVAVWSLSIDGTNRSTEVASRRSNLVLFSIQDAKLHCECTVEMSTLVSCQFSSTKPHYLYTVEEATGGGGYIGVNTCNYEYVDGKINKLMETHIRLEDCVCIAERSNSEDKMLLACQDGLLVLQDDNSRTLQPSPSQLNEPRAIHWHPADAIVLVGDRQGCFQCFDMALSPLLLVMASAVPSPSVLIDAGKIIGSSSQLQFIHWSPSLTAAPGGGGAVYNDSALLVFSRGPLCLLQFQLGVLSRGRIGPLQLAIEYIKTGQSIAAVNILKKMNWNTQSKACFTIFTLLMDHLLKPPLDSNKESLCEGALVTFLAPSQAIADTVIVQYKERIINIARRFFHLLLRYRRFEKAYLLAVDINSRDLFMDLHFIAQEFGETALAQVTRRKAEQIQVDRLSVSLDALELGSISSGLSGSTSALSTDQIPLELQSTDEEQEHFEIQRRHSTNDSQGRTTKDDKDEDRAPVVDAMPANVTVVHFGVV